MFLTKSPVASVSTPSPIQASVCPNGFHIHSPHLANGSTSTQPCEHCGLQGSTPRRPSLTQRLSRLPMLQPSPREHPNYFGPDTPGLPPYVSPASEQRATFNDREEQDSPEPLPSTASILETLYPPNRSFARDVPDFRELSSTFTTGQTRRRAPTTAASPLRNEFARSRRESELSGLGIRIGREEQYLAPVLPETPVGDGLEDSIRNALDFSNRAQPEAAAEVTATPPRVLSTPPPRSAERPTPAPEYTSLNPPGLYPSARRPASGAASSDTTARRRAAFQTLGAMQEHSELLNVPRAPRLPSGSFMSPYAEQAAQEGWYEPPPPYGPHASDPVLDIRPGIIITSGGTRDHPRVGLLLDYQCSCPLGVSIICMTSGYVEELLNVIGRQQVSVCTLIYVPVSHTLSHLLIRDMSSKFEENLVGDVTPLDSSLYKLEDEQKVFFKATTGITDDEDLKKHILNVQAKAYALRPYPCIQRFTFIGIGITKNTEAYQQLLKIVGNDARKAIFDGFPMQNVVTSDLHGGTCPSFTAGIDSEARSEKYETSADQSVIEFWQLGHALFKTTPEKYTVPFVGGDVFDPAHLALAAPLATSSIPPAPRPDIYTLTSLNPLRGHVSAIFASSFFHLFSEPQQLELARKLAGLLDPRPGSMIFGMHAGGETKGTRKGPGDVPNKDWDLFFHSPETWTEMWDGEVFPKGSVKVQAYLATLDERWKFLRWIRDDRHLTVPQKLGLELILLER
ncbi:hypothetical protein EVG20_g7080 [Dentipellis fragilis]|uniref:Methyltransferase type 11 domain-containing protein n=1 Tax=Dentipellis fragilis TaxID=205917 RepID=A0A4Y9YGY0_9AGAM|nr:hypothetical protein EVG20_g7080 [Dentipellis fragilis]